MITIFFAGVIFGAMFGILVMSLIQISKKKTPTPTDSSSGSVAMSPISKPDLTVSKVISINFPIKT